MSDLHVYTTTAEFDRAWEENENGRRAFVAGVVIAWDEKHPDTPVAWVVDPFGADRHPVGFVDVHPKEPAPEGLSRSQERRYLIPARGRKGDVYREVLKRMHGLPSRTPVMEAFGIPPRVRAPGPDFSIRMCPVGVQRFEDTLWVSCSEPINSRNLVTARLSDFYAAKERHAEMRQAIKVLNSATG